MLLRGAGRAGLCLHPGSRSPESPEVLEQQKLKQHQSQQWEHAKEGGSTSSHAGGGNWELDLVGKWWSDGPSCYEGGGERARAPTSHLPSTHLEVQGHPALAMAAHLPPPFALPEPRDTLHDVEV